MQLFKRLTEGAGLGRRNSREKCLPSTSRSIGTTTNQKEDEIDFSLNQTSLSSDSSSEDRSPELPPKSSTLRRRFTLHPSSAIKAFHFRKSATLPLKLTAKKNKNHESSFLKSESSSNELTNTSSTSTITYDNDSASYQNLSFQTNLNNKDSEDSMKVCFGRSSLESRLAENKDAPTSLASSTITLRQAGTGENIDQCHYSSVSEVATSIVSCDMPELQWSEVTSAVSAYSSVASAVSSSISPGDRVVIKSSGESTPRVFTSTSESSRNSHENSPALRSLREMLTSLKSPDDEIYDNANVKDYGMINKSFPNSNPQKAKISMGVQNVNSCSKCHVLFSSRNQLQEHWLLFHTIDVPNAAPSFKSDTLPKSKSNRPFLDNLKNKILNRSNDEETQFPEHDKVGGNFFYIFILQLICHFLLLYFC